ncbi:unnamed protein product [Hydatigera taeniaeformis]|uniref:Cation_ATPase_C domain-containing protein n=1 Tax=Hydatigena taeniaeformis TaxID=6205 RepID=A0A0R3WM45_HYDTA|nr:unnamed protein product [Hydatigera taeniaeformis]
MVCSPALLQFSRGGLIEFLLPFAVCSLSENQSLLVMPPWANYWLLGAMMMSIGLHFFILEVDFLANVFQLTPLSVEEWFVVFEFSVPVILIDEVLKLIARKFTDGKLVVISLFH